MTYRERRLAKAERLRDWADKRETKAAASFAASNRISDMIPMGQPILVGHHSERRHRRDIDRIHRGMSQGVEHSKKADDFRSRADNIEAAADRAIYDDDPDAIERLREKLANLEASRETMKAFNKTVRKGAPDWSLLTESQAESFKSAARHFPWVARKGFDLSNTSGLITKTRQRLEGLEREAKNDATRSEYEAAGATIALCPNQNWIEVAFPDRPERNVLDELRAAGFYWNRKRGCWQGPITKLPERYRQEVTA